MELNNKRGLTETMCTNMSLNGYLKRLGYQPVTKDLPEIAIDTINVKGKGQSKGQPIRQPVLMAAENYLRAKGLSNPEACDGVCDGQVVGRDPGGTSPAGCQSQKQAQGCDHCIGCGGGLERFGSQEGGQVGSFGALWGSLKMLRQRMKMTGAHRHQGPQSSYGGGNCSGAYGLKGRQSMSDQHGLPRQAEVGHSNFQGGLSAQGQHQGANGFQGVLPQDQTNSISIESQLPAPGPGVGKKRGVRAMVMTPFRSLMTSDMNFAELACAPTHHSLQAWSQTACHAHDCQV